MRLLAFLDGGEAVMGILADSGVVPIETLERFYADAEAALSRARRLTSRAENGPARDPSSVKFVPPVPVTARILCLGLNYREHAAESRSDIPKVPVVFGRFASTLACDGELIPLPSGDDRFDWEAELAVVLARPLSNATESEAARALLGYTCFNDLSARGYQLATSQWTLGKNVDRSGPIGPVIVTPDEVGDPYRLRITCRVNGQVMQSGSTSDMIFRAPEILSYTSGSMRLQPGDVLSTGTPEGVGFTRNPPVYLKPGDRVEVEIEGIGVLHNTIG